MKNLLFYLGLLLPVSAHAVDPAVIQANDQYFDILKRIEIVKDKNISTIERRKAFSNFANEFGDPGANWQTLKVGVLEIIGADATFWANEMTQSPAIQEKLVRDFSMDWYQEDTSNYAEKLALAKTELKRTLEQIEKQKKMLNELLQKLENTHATTLE